MMMAVESSFDKAREIVEELTRFVEVASSRGERIDLVERELFSRLLMLGCEFLQAYVHLAGDGDVGEVVEHDDVTLRRSKDKHQRPYRSIFGVLEISRWVYGVREGQKARYLPLDSRLGLPEGEHSYVLEDWLQQFCVQNAFSSSVKSLADLLGIKTSTRTAERMNRKLGQYVESYRMHRRKTMDEEAEILVVTADGKGVPMRRTLEEQAGLDVPAWRRFHQRQQDSKAAERATKRLAAGQVRTRKQMAYVGGVYTISRWTRTADDVLDEIKRTQTRCDRPQPKNKRVWAEMTQYHGKERWDGQPRLFAGLAWEAYSRDPEKRKTMVCLMDGQRSLWNVKQEWLPRAVGILDIFHATEWLWKAAYCFHKQGSRQAEELVTHYLRMLLEGKVSHAIGSLRRKSHQLSAANQETLNKVIRYFSNNKQYMRYDEYLSQGYPIGSGVVEGACRHLVRDRMERTGMRWDVTGSQAMLHTRSTFVNGEWRRFLEHRIEIEQNALYKQAA